MRFVKRRRAAAEIAEDESRAGLGRRLQRRDALVEKQEGVAREWDFEEDDGERDLQQEAGHDDPHRHTEPILAQQPREQQQRRDPQQPPIAPPNVRGAIVSGRPRGR